MRAITSDDAEHCALRTMTRISGATKIATPATGVDLTDNPLAGCQRPDREAGARRSGYCPVFRQTFDHAHKLVSDRSLKVRIPARDLQIRVANARQGDPHDGFAVCAGFGDIDH